jgi:hypothetical protein
VAQAVRVLVPSKREALGSDSSTVLKKKKNMKNWMEDCWKKTAYRPRQLTNRR